MAQYRFDVEMDSLSLLPRDTAVNSLYYSVADQAAGESAADDLLDLYDGLAGSDGPLSVHGITVKMYDITGGPVIYTTVRDGEANSSSAPAQVSLCLSYYGTANTGRDRGRIYVGPLKASVVTGPRPSDSLLAQWITFGTSLSTLAGSGAWKLFSRADATLKSIDHIWVDDRWDIQRRRALLASKRSQATV